MAPVAKNFHSASWPRASDWLVVGKPPHLLVHPTRPGGPVTLLDHLRGLLACELASGGQVSLIHRLDRETSGAAARRQDRRGRAAVFAGDDARRHRQGIPRAGVGLAGMGRPHGGRAAAAAGREGAVRDLAQAHDPSRRRARPDAVRDRCAGSSADGGRFALVRARARRPGGCTRFACTSRTPAIRSSATKSTGRTKAVTCGSSKPAGRRNSRASCCSTATRCTPGG